eukprot:23525-Chlamydomonas_euryale.AAC.8
MDAEFENHFLRLGAAGAARSRPLYLRWSGRVNASAGCTCCCSIAVATNSAKSLKASMLMARRCKQNCSSSWRRRLGRCFRQESAWPLLVVVVLSQTLSGIAEFRMLAAL